MTLKYVLRNFRRRKVRTLLMVLALTVGVGTLVALNATVDSYRRFYAGTVAGEVGAYDLAITRKDTAPNPFMDAAAMDEAIRDVPGVFDVAPRIHAAVEMTAGDQTIEKPMVALDPERDTFGQIEITDGEYDLGTSAEGLPGAVVLQETADTFGLEVGDLFELQYAPPVTRLPGQAPAPEGASRRRTTAQWLITGVGRQRGVTGQGNNDGVIIGLAGAWERFGLEGQAERILVGYDPALFDSSDPQRSSWSARDVSLAVRAVLGVEEFNYTMPRARAVLNGASQFILIQSLITMYGLLSLSVVGLLVRTLVMTSVQEQTRDMAVIRILGATRRFLFNLVATEVAAIGVVGIGLGILVGQTINNLGIVPFLEERSGGLLADVPPVSLSAILIAVLVAVVMLAVSTLAPARTAAGTKVMHAINPGVAQGLGLDDLAKMREARTDFRVTGIGLVTLLFPSLVFFAFPLAFDFGILWVLAALLFGSLLAMIIGTALVFFVVILPFEKLLLFVIDVIMPQAGYFVRRTVLRTKERNTLIALMIVVSATLPSFLSTTLALEVANTATDRRMMGGAPMRARAPYNRDGPPALELEVLDELRAEPAFAATAGLTWHRNTTVSDGVGLRDARVHVVGVDADLEPVLYDEAVAFTQADPSTLGRVVREPGTAIIAEALATHFGKGVGDQLVLEGEGRDHLETVTIIGVAKRIGGVGEFSAKQTRVMFGDSAVLVGIDTHRALSDDPVDGPPDPMAPVIRTLMVAPAEGTDEAQLTRDLRLDYGTRHGVRVDSTAETIETVREEARTGQLFLVVLTALTSVLAVFGVFAVIYVSIYSRRAEIGMLKAVGCPGRHLLKMFVGEAMVMTLSATLTGVSAGALLGYVMRVSQSFQMEVPTVFAIDPVVTSAMLVLMIVSSLVSAIVATHSYRRQRAIDIQRSI